MRSQLATYYSLLTVILLLPLQGCFLVHFLLSWYFRDRYYRLYLRVKYAVKNRTVWRHGKTFAKFDDPDEKKHKKGELSLKNFFGRSKPKGVGR